MKQFVSWVAVVMLLMAQGCAQMGGRGDGSKDEGEKAADIYSNLGLGYLRQGRLELALEKLERAIEHDSNHPASNHYIAEVYKQLGEIEQADKYYAKAVKLDPANPMVLNNYGAFLCGQARFEDAENYLVRAANTPRYAAPELAFENLALCALRLDNNVKAEEYFRKALKINPTMPKALFRMAEINVDKKDFMRARAFLQRYHSAAAKSANSLRLGIKIEEAMEDEEAAQVYRQYLRENFPQSDDKQS